MKALTYTATGRFELIEKAKPEILNRRMPSWGLLLRASALRTFIFCMGLCLRRRSALQWGMSWWASWRLLALTLAKSSRATGLRWMSKHSAARCFYCRRGYVNNCTSGGWMLGCRIDGGQAEYYPCAIRRQWSDSDSRQCERRAGSVCRRHTRHRLLGCQDFGDFCGRYSADYRSRSDRTVYARMCPVYNSHRIIVCEADESRREFVRQHYPNVDVVKPTECLDVLDSLTEGRVPTAWLRLPGGDTFELHGVAPDRIPSSRLSHSTRRNRFCPCRGCMARTWRSRPAV